MSSKKSELPLILAKTIYKYKKEDVIELLPQKSPSLLPADHLRLQGRGPFTALKAIVKRMAPEVLEWGSNRANKIKSSRGQLLVNFLALGPGIQYFVIPLAFNMYYASQHLTPSLQADPSKISRTNLPITWISADMVDALRSRIESFRHEDFIDEGDTTRTQANEAFSIFQKRAVHNMIKVLIDWNMAVPNLITKKDTEPSCDGTKDTETAPTKTNQQQAKTERKDEKAKAKKRKTKTNDSKQTEADSAEEPVNKRAKLEPPIDTDSEHAPFDFSGYRQLEVNVKKCEDRAKVLGEFMNLFVQFSKKSKDKKY